MPLPWASLVAVLTQHYRYMHLGRASLNPPSLVLEVGDFNISDRRAYKVEVPPLGTLKWGDFNFACMPACKVEVWGIHAGPTQLYLLSRCEL